MENDNKNDQIIFTPTKNKFIQLCYRALAEAKFYSYPTKWHNFIYFNPFSTKFKVEDMVDFVGNTPILLTSKIKPGSFLVTEMESFTGASAPSETIIVGEVSEDFFSIGL